MVVHAFTHAPKMHLCLCAHDWLSTFVNMLSWIIRERHVCLCECVDIAVSSNGGVRKEHETNQPTSQPHYNGGDKVAMSHAYHAVPAPASISVARVLT